MSVSATAAPPFDAPPFDAPAADAILAATIWHGRHGDPQLQPAGDDTGTTTGKRRPRRARRDFTYHARYLWLDVDAIDAGRTPVAVDRAGLWRLRLRDYGPRDGTALRPWAEALFRDAGIDPERMRGDGASPASLSLVTLPRSALYGFNPVSFWLLHGADGLRAALAEVSSTFGERHCYIIAHPDGRIIGPGDRIEGDKVFHVSPFLPREGRYGFRFDIRPGHFAARIDWTNGTTRLDTSLAGPLTPLTGPRLRRASLRHPFQPERIMALIHWQAALIYARRLPFFRQPAQQFPAVSHAMDRAAPAQRGHEHD